jgi:predicted DNA-binding transcriptional regulator AlpA
MANTKVIHTGPSLADILLMEEVSELTRIPLSTLRFYRHVGKGGPRSFRLGNRVVYKRADIEAWIESQYQAEGAR